jgi:hypothetical protein
LDRPSFRRGPGKAEVYDFIIGSNAFKRLGAIRKLISARLDEVEPLKRRRRVERRLKEVRPWK